MTSKNVIMQYSQVETNISNDLYLASQHPTDADFYTFLLKYRYHVNILLKLYTEPVVNSEPGSTVVHALFHHGLSRSCSFTKCAQSTTWLTPFTL